MYSNLGVEGTGGCGVTGIQDFRGSLRAVRCVDGRGERGWIFVFWVL